MSQDNPQIVRKVFYVTPDNTRHETEAAAQDHLDRDELTRALLDIREMSAAGVALNYSAFDEATARFVVKYWVSIYGVLNEHMKSVLARAAKRVTTE